MSERLPEPQPPRTTYPPVEVDEQLARKNMIWGWSLFALCILIFAGTFAVAYVYLALD
ncbi:MAG: hypothetical protein M3R70_06930 [Actinomycetota bacterium]|nr:hypothetical protein [Actinomycetota bacterium]